jgi:hypothetical protein
MVQPDANDRQGSNLMQRKGRARKQPDAKKMIVKAARTTNRHWTVQVKCGNSRRAEATTEPNQLI